MSKQTLLKLFGLAQMSSEGARLHAIIVTYRRPEALPTTIRSLLNQSRTPDSVIIVDNDPEGSARATAVQFGFTYLGSGHNSGPAGGIASGMEVILREANDRDAVLIVDDDDPLPAADVVERLLHALDDALANYPRCAGVGMTGARYRNHRGDFIRVPDSDLRGLVSVDYIGGGQAPVYIVGAIRAVGTFDERLFFGFDDADYGLRLRAAGWRLFVPGDLWYERRVAAQRLDLPTTLRSTKPPPSWRQYYSSRNVVHLARLYGTRRALAETVVRGLTVTPLRRLTRQRSPSGAVASVRGTLAGIRGRLGRTVNPP